jgi:hypothetical protein
MLQRFLLWAVIAGAVVYADEDVLRPKGRTEQAPTVMPEGIVRSPWALGIELGGTLSLFGQDITLYQSPDYQTNLTSGSGLGPLVNLAIDYALTDNVGLQARLGFDQKNFSSTGYLDAPCEQPPGSGYYTPARINRTSSQTINYWTGGLALRYRFEQNWILVGGFTYHSTSSASFSQTDTIISPGCQFYNDIGIPEGQTKKTSGTNTSVFEAHRWSFDLSIGYRIPISENIVFLPRLGFQAFGTQLAPDDQTSGVHPVVGQLYGLTNRRLHALMLALGLWFNL